MIDQSAAGEQLVLLGAGAAGSGCPSRRRGISAWQRAGTELELDARHVVEDSKIRRHHPAPSRSHGIAAIRTRMELPKLIPGKRYALPRPVDQPTPCCWPGSACAKERWPADRHRHRRRRRRPAPARRAALLRPRSALRPVPDWETLPLRQLLAAPGPDQRAVRDPGASSSATSAGSRRGDGAGHHGALPARAAPLPGWRDTFEFRVRQSSTRPAARPSSRWRATSM